jgi:hypothetical protein
MTRIHREPTLEEILSEPIVRAMMKADSVEPHDLTEMLRRVARRRREATQSDRVLTRSLF